MNELIDPMLASSLSISPPTMQELAQQSTQQLRSKLAQTLEISARTLGYMAAVWRELESRGEDLSDLRVGLASYLPLIAAGQLDAQAVVQFAGSATVLRLISTLPIAEQRRLASGEKVEVLSLGEDGTVESVALPVRALTATQARIALAAGHVRRPEEQRAMLEAERMRVARRARPGANARVRYDARTDKIRIGSASAPVGEVIAAIAASAHSPASDEEADKALVIKLTETERRGLQLRAAQAGMTQQDYCRMLLVMQNLL